LQGSEKCLPYA